MPLTELEFLTAQNEEIKAGIARIEKAQGPAPGPARTTTDYDALTRLISIKIDAGDLSARAGLTLEMAKAHRASLDAAIQSAEKNERPAYKW